MNMRNYKTIKVKIYSFMSRFEDLLGNTPAGKMPEQALEEIGSNLFRYYEPTYFDYYLVGKNEDIQDILEDVFEDIEFHQVEGDLKLKTYNVRDHLIGSGDIMEYEDKFYWVNPDKGFTEVEFKD